MDETAADRGAFAEAVVFLSYFDDLPDPRRRGKVGCSWYVDETYIKVHGRWCYLYRAIDRNGNLIDVLFSEHRDIAAAQEFFRSAQAVTGITPDRVTTDGHDSYPRAIRTTLGKRVRHRCSRYLNNSNRGMSAPYRWVRHTARRLTKSISMSSHSWWGNHQSNQSIHMALSRVGAAELPATTGHKELFPGIVPWPFQRKFRGVDCPSC